MTKSIHPTLLATLLLPLGFAMVGCKTQSTQTACVWVFSSEECDEPDQSDDEVGNSDESGEEPEGPACIAAADGTTRTLHQCMGGFEAGIAFTAIGKTCPSLLGSEAACEEQHLFGSEPYPMTKVMACCDPYDDASDHDEYLNFCAADLAQQICTSVSERLKALIDDGQIPASAEAVNLQNWIATHQGECFTALWAGNTATMPGQLESEWVVPNEPGWQVVIQDFTITVKSGGVVDVRLPDDPDEYIDCVDAGYNDVEVFESNVPASPGAVTDYVLGSASGDVILRGPELFGGPVTGNEALAALAGQCAPPWCSTLELAIDPDGRAWSLVDLSLYISGPASLGNGSARLDVERASARLYSSSRGVITQDSAGGIAYEVPVGAAHFLVTGASDLGVGLYMLENTSPLVLHESRGLWSIDAFGLQYVDIDGATWSVSVPATSWN